MGVPHSRSVPLLPCTYGGRRDNPPLNRICCTPRRPDLLYWLRITEMAIFRGGENACPPK